MCAVSPITGQWWFNLFRLVSLMCHNVASFKVWPAGGVKLARNEVYNSGMSTLNLVSQVQITAGLSSGVG